MAQGHEPHLKLYKPVKAAEISPEMLADVLSSWVWWPQVSLLSILREDNCVVPSAKRAPLALQHAHPEEGAAGISPHQAVCGRAPHQAGPMMDFLAPWPNQTKKTPAHVGSQLLGEKYKTPNMSCWVNLKHHL